MLKANYHTHLKYCNHAIGEACDYVAKAIELGMEEIGISDHAPVPEEFVEHDTYIASKTYRFMKLENLDIYINDCKRAIEKYSDKINILIGLESEFLPNHLEYYRMLRERVDYLNLGAHYFLDHNGHHKNTYKDLDYTNIMDYVDTVISGMSTGLFSALVHPDLFFYAYKDINGNRVFDSLCIEASKRIIEAAIKYDVYLEINANGIFNSNNKGLYDYKDWLYPYYKFWEIASSYENLKVIVGADAHKPENLGGSHIRDAINLAKLCGIKLRDRMEVKN